MKRIITIFLFIIINLIFYSTYSNGAVNISGKNFMLHNQGYARETGYYFIETNTGLWPTAKISQTNSTGTVENNQDTEAGIYSMKTTSTNSLKNAEKYSQYFDLNNYSSIQEEFRNQVFDDENKYNQLSWILNNICIPENTLSKQALLASARIEENAFKNYNINNQDKTKVEKDIIESIQQAAIWHFMNAGGENHPEDNLKLYYATNEKDIRNINDFSNQGEDNVNKLYQYLINGAKSQTQSNVEDTLADSPITFNKEEVEINNIDSNYIIGPYNISASDSKCTLEVKVNNNVNELADVRILGEDVATELVGATTTHKIINNLGKNFYISIPNTTSATTLSVNVETNYNAKDLKYWSTSANKVSTSEPVAVVRSVTKRQAMTDTRIIAKPKFDFALRQYVKAINEREPDNSRQPTYKLDELKALATNTATLDGGTTLTKKTKKDPLSVNQGDRVIFAIRVYNEGQIDGKVPNIKEFLPEGLELVSEEESDINRRYKWKKLDNNPRILTTDYLSNEVILKYDLNPRDGNYKINFQEIQLECKVTSENKTTDTLLKVIGEIGETSNNNNEQDRDSMPNNLNDAQKNDYNPGTSSEGKGYEDDDDYEQLIVKGTYLDLALRTYVLEVDTPNKNKIEYNRQPKVDTSTLTQGEETARYLHTKSPVGVELGSAITYEIRIFNEGQIDGYADEIIIHLPEELEYVNDETNAENGWIIDTTDETQRTLKTNKLSKQNDNDNSIKAFRNSNGELQFKDIKLKCKIKPTAQALKEITLIAEINKSSCDANFADRDNKTNVAVPSDNDLPKYIGNTSNKEELTDNDYYYKGQEDDDDFEKIILEKFDFALKSFVSKVNGKDIKDREPVLDTSSYGTIVDNKNTTTFKYTTPQENMKLCENDVVTLTIRIYNEGTQDGYAAMIGNNIPNGFEFLPNDETNQEYKWTMHDQGGQITNDVGNAKYLSTRYLEKGFDGDDNLIKSYKNDIVGYKDVKIVFKITNKNLEKDRNIKNETQIIQVTDGSEGKVNDIDSAPNSWIAGEDDQDEEIIYIKFFDLSLKMTIDQTIVVENGRQKENKTNNSLEGNEQQLINIPLSKKQIENNIIKFNYLIQVKNEGEIEGYVTEISDYIPSGMKFNQADNMKWREKNGKLVTEQLKNEIIKPGEAKNINLLLTWDNDEGNIGVKSNFSEISAYSNKSATADIDSIVDNKKDDEDDITNSQIEIVATEGITGKVILIGIGILVIIVVGVILIKKFVL